ncbi:MAG: aspartate-semialdehyde dehydrogenase [Clostridiales bacterium]|jgi:aspartate-semialdehyde dehydrogenase|nr:aspartate-semialdehyde dehydrogenase [Clostridiales bacterium]
MTKFNVGVLGGTGMVGQRFISCLEGHPWFTVTAIAASPRSAGKTYQEAVAGRWAMEKPVPEGVKNIIVQDASDVEKVADTADFVFSAVDMKKEEIFRLEEAYARRECPVVSNNSAHRAAADVPMIIPELNPGHLAVIETQRRRLGTSRGFIAVKSNCSIQSYVPALHPLREYGLERVLACTYQAVSGAGKNLETWPEMRDNVIPFIPGEEEKSEREPLKVWGSVINGGVVPAEKPVITTQCIRVPVSDGHLAAVFCSFAHKPPKDEIIDRWNSFAGKPQILGLPSAPKQFLHYFDEDNQPQTRPDRGLEGGMAVSVGRLRPDTVFDYKFVCLFHNTLRGAAGGAILLAELLVKEGII